MGSGVYVRLSPDRTAVVIAIEDEDGRRHEREISREHADETASWLRMLAEIAEPLAR